MKLRLELAIQVGHRLAEIHHLSTEQVVKDALDDFVRNPQSPFVLYINQISKELAEAQNDSKRES